MQPGAIGPVRREIGLLTARTTAPSQSARLRRGRSFTAGALLLCARLAIPSLVTATPPLQSTAPPSGARLALQDAARLVEQARLDEAEQQARRAVADPDTQAVAYSVLGTIRFQQNRLAESVVFFKKAIRLDGRLPGAHLSLAQVYILDGKPALASPLCEKVIALDPSNAIARLTLARAETEQGHYRRALDVAAPAIDAFKHSPEGVFVLATAYLKAGNRAAALALADDWARLVDIPQAWAVKTGALFATNGAARQAIAVLERAQQAGPPSYEVAFNLAGAYLLDDEPARALDAYDAALSVQPDAVPALRQAAALAERRGELERSLSYWLRAKKIAANDPEILLGFGRVCLRMDLLDDAELALVRAASLKPTDTTCQYTLAAAKVGKRQFEAAEQLLDPLVAAHADDARLQYALGSVLYLQGRLSDAAAHLRESLRLQPDQLASAYYLALVVRDEGNDAEAMTMLERLLQRFPDHAAASEVLGGLLMTAQRYADAEHRLREAIRLNPTSVKANYQLGLLLARMGRKEESERQLALAKTLREEDETNSRLQLRLLDPGQ